jgi:hypothetical protein
MAVLEDGRPARLSDRGISVRERLDNAGSPWQRLLGYFASGTEGQTLAHGPAISALDCGQGLVELGNTVWLGGGARTRGETEPVLRCLCAARAAMWLEAGTGPWKKESLALFCSVLLSSRKPVGR